MTLQELREKEKEFLDNIVQIIIDDGTKITGILQNSFEAFPKDPRGYTEPYFYLLRVDKQNNPIECFFVSQIGSIEQLDNPKKK